MEDFELEANEDPIELEQGITLVAPGLSGSCRYVGVRVQGTTRALTAEKTGLDEAIQEANLEDRHTLVIEAPTPEPENEQGGRGGVFQDAVRNNEILLQVPGYQDERQFLMYTDEAGIISFHYPEPVKPDLALPSTRSVEAAVQNQYRITLRSGQDQNPAESASDSRGLFGKVGSKILKILVTKVFKDQAGKAVHWTIQEWENRYRAFQGLHGGQNFTELMSKSPVPFDKWDDIRDKKALLFIHGTSSSTAGAFAGLLTSGIPDSLYEQYQGRVLAFNHHTMSIGVADNVKQVYDAFAGHPGNYTFDIICHSRGGLVARALNHLPDDFIAQRLDGWQRPQGVNIKVDRIIFVATPNAGTDLARPENLSAMIERLANFVNQFPDGLASISGGMLLTLASSIVDTGLPYVPGLEDQSPVSKLIAVLQDDSEHAKRYYGFGADYEVTGNLRTVVKAGVDSVVDRLFSDKANDLVVPTLGVSNNIRFCLDAGQVHDFNGSQVYHTNFFFQAEIKKILEFLAE
ncbi:esterase/lipase family protein [Methylobacter sp.]|uniref:esterase/lipase family protein n=1 Tax=Methylobacter sp. TaxID=2051955 RepID=UPI002FDE7ED1